MGFFAKKNSYTFIYEKNGAKNKITIKATSKNEAIDKFNRKIGFAENIEIIEN